MTPIEVILIVLQLIFLEGILSIDNAAVLGAMVSKLPAKTPVPWPQQFRTISKWGDRLFGPQRVAALKVGLLGAYVGRAVMLLLATVIIDSPWLRLLGAAYLFKLAIEHLGSRREDWDEEEEAEEMSLKVAGKGFWSMVIAVELADLAFSLDNVVAAVALSPVFWVVLLGVALGILTMRFAAQIFTHLIEREPVLSTAAYLLVLAIGCEIFIGDVGLLLHQDLEISNWQKFMVSLSILILSVVYAHTPWLQHLFTPLFQVLKKFFCHINKAADFLLYPFAWGFRKLSHGISWFFRQLTPSHHII